MAAALVECRGLAAGYLDKPVLKGVDLRLDGGESVALLGPNGSGKSTLLRALTKTLPIASGEIRIQGDGLPSLATAEIARRVGFVPQDEPAHFSFLVRELVLMGRLARSSALFDTPEDRQAANEAMEQTDCLHLADRPITELSGGERQRVLIARALAQQTRILLLDEPTAHLDPAHQVSVAELVRSLAQEGRATLCAVHDLNLAGRMASRGVLLIDGTVGLDAPIEEVLESPLLDQAYGVRFERFRSESGRTLVIPDRIGG